MDQCLLRQLEKCIDSLMSELADVCHGVLLLDHDSKELLEQGSSLEKALYALDLKVKCLLHKQATSPKLTGIHQVRPGVKLPKISVPMFDGDIMEFILGAV